MITTRPVPASSTALAPMAALQAQVDSAQTLLDVYEVGPPPPPNMTAQHELQQLAVKQKRCLQVMGMGALGLAAGILAPGLTVAGIVGTALIIGGLVHLKRTEEPIRQARKQVGDIDYYNHYQKTVSGIRARLAEAREALAKGAELHEVARIHTTLREATLAASINETRSAVSLNGVRLKKRSAS